MPDLSPGSHDARTSNQQRVCITGSGIDAFAAGNALHDAGHDVTVRETLSTPSAESPHLEPVIVDVSIQRFLGAHAATDETDGDAAARPDTKLGVPVDEYRYVDDDGSTRSSVGVDLRATATDTLAASLRDAFPAERIETDPEAALAAPHTQPHDLHLGADGWLSETRQRLLPDVTPEYAGYVAWNGSIPESAIPRDLTRQFEHAITVSRGSHDLLVAMPLPGADGSTSTGSRRLSWVWYSPVADRDLGTVLTDRHGENHDQAVPPGDLQDRFADALRTRAADHAPAMTRLVRATPDPGVEPIVDLTVPEAVVDRTAFLGAASFATRQHAATRVTKSIDDANALVTALDRYDDIDSALADWNHTQSVRGRQLVEQGRQTDLDELLERA